MPCEQWHELLERHRYAAKIYSKPVDDLDGSDFNPAWQSAEAARRRNEYNAVNMKVALNIVDAFLVLFRTVWFLQGINVLPGSFMTGQVRWAVCGGIAVVRESRF